VGSGGKFRMGWQWIQVRWQPDWERCKTVSVVVEISSSLVVIVMVIQMII
jgi:hypothetical protein